MADEEHHISKHSFKTPFVCGARNLGEALRRISEGATMIRTKVWNLMSFFDLLCKKCKSMFVCKRYRCIFKREKQVPETLWKQYVTHEQSVPKYNLRKQ